MPLPPDFVPDSIHVIATYFAEQHGVRVNDLKGPRVSPAMGDIRRQAIRATRGVHKPNGEPRFSYTQLSHYFGVSPANIRDAVKDLQPDRNEALTSPAWLQ